MKSAVLFGASGLVGSNLLTQLLNHPGYERVTVVVRRPLSIQHPKLNMLIGDYNSLPSLKDQLTGDEIYLSLGTTKKSTPDLREYYRIDHDYSVLAARYAKENGAQSVVLVSAVGADAGSKLFYVRLKGEVERDIIALDFDHTYIFQPSMLMGDRQERRPLEKFLIGAFRLINPLFVGSWKKYRGIDVEILAKAMIDSTKEPGKLNYYQWQDIHP